VIGFNSQLKLNDGLLTQDYMDTYGTNFADASRMVTKAVDELKYFLHLNGYLDIHGLGEMTQTINNQYTFKPYNDGIMTPDLYALSSFHINYLNEVREEPSRIISHVFTATTDVNNITSDVTEDVEDTDDIKIYSNNRKRVYLFSAITVAAALLIFFLFPVRINNTELSKVNVAQLIPVDAFGGASEVKKHSQQSVAYHTKKIAVKPDSVSDKYFIVKLSISPTAKTNRNRSNIVNRKCAKLRASFAKVLDIYDPKNKNIKRKTARSMWNNKFIYTVGSTVIPAFLL